MDVVRTAQPTRHPIVLGGSVLGTDADVLAFTGADHVTNDLDEVIHLCGLTTLNPSDAHSAPEA